MIKKTDIASRAVSIIAAVLVHILILFFAVFTIKTAVNSSGEAGNVMKIIDIREELPEPPVSFTQSPDITAEITAEVIIEEDNIVSGETSGGEEAINFLPMHLVSHLPVFSEDELRRRIIYPPIAQRSEIEGTVYLEVFVDREGTVRNVTVLREDPPDRGFGEAAARAFFGLKGSPALANGQEVAARYRYPVRFTLR